MPAQAGIHLAPGEAPARPGRGSTLLAPEEAQALLTGALGARVSGHDASEVHRVLLQTARSAAPKVAWTQKQSRCRSFESRITNHESPPSNGFSLVELLVAVAVFAALAAAAYGGLSSIARTRGALVAQQDRFAAITRAIGGLERDLRQAVARPVRDEAGIMRPALIGRGDGLELTRLGFADPRREASSNLSRLALALDGRELKRRRYAVLDRAPGSVPTSSTVLDRVDGFMLRYLGQDGAWQTSWPPAGADADVLPRAVELRLVLDDLGELRRMVELSGSPYAVAPPAAGVP